MPRRSNTSSTRSTTVGRPPQTEETATTTMSGADAPDALVQREGPRRTVTGAEDVEEAEQDEAHPSPSGLDRTRLPATGAHHRPSSPCRIPAATKPMHHRKMRPGRTPPPPTELRTREAATPTAPLSLPSSFVLESPLQRSTHHMRTFIGSSHFVGPCHVERIKNAY
jgi:hypothetical protein